MSAHPDAIFMHLASGPLSARLLAENLGVSQPTVSRAIGELGGDIVRIGAARSIQYALRDTARGLPDIPVYQVDPEGRLSLLGTLVPTRPEGFVMMREDGMVAHSDGLPWWLLDMRPQGYIGRAYAARHVAELGLPPRLTDWSDTHALRALLAHGHDVVGSLLLGDIARDRFLTAALPDPIAEARKAAEYARFALQAASGEIPGSSAGGEQPKFMSYAVTSGGPRHVMVKFSERDEGPVTERWRDLLLAEHLALETLRDAGIAAARTRIVDSGDQRFLEVERFDRVGSLGRRVLVSLAALDAEFVGSGNGAWPIIARRLADSGELSADAVVTAETLWAFGTLIGNTDMHSGNLSFFSEPARPCAIAPAYDMGPMAFAPRSGGGLPSTLADAMILASVSNNIWRHAEALARAFLARLVAAKEFSRRFEPCVAALERHVETANAKISRLG